MASPQELLVPGTLMTFASLQISKLVSAGARVLGSVARRLATCAGRGCGADEFLNGLVWWAAKPSGIGTGKGREVKVGFVITRADAVGGAQVHVRDMACALRARGHQVDVIVGRSGPFLDALEDVGVGLWSLRWLHREVAPWNDLRAVSELRELLHGLQLDIVSSHSSKAGIVTRIAARLARVPCLFTAHGWAFTDGVGRGAAHVYRLAERMMGPLADRIITVSDHDLDLALRYRIAPRSKLVTVRNGMPDVAADRRARPETGAARLLMVARFEHQKDHDTLLRALAGIEDEPWSLDLIGDGSRRAQLEAMALDLGLADRVRFLGTRADVDDHLANASIFVLSTHWEGLPRSIIEAMRAGLPVVATAVGGVTELVRDGRTGYTVPRRDVRTLRDRLHLLVRDAALRAELGARGRSTYEHEFTFDRMYDETLRVYHDVLRSTTGAVVAA